MITVYQYPKCGTCRKALKWLDEKGVAYETIDIVETPPSKDLLTKAWNKSGLTINKFFNTSGQSYRNGGFKEKLKTMTEADALSALAADGKLIKRPLVLAGDDVLVGFKEADYATKLG